MCAKLGFPGYLWDGEEMIRKLTLCVVGVFW
jgi:hypothetical protein